MKGEMYVSMLISLSEQARAVATSILGVGFKERQLEALRASDALEELSHRLNCAEAKVFEEFGKQIQETFGQQSQSVFTYTSFEILCDRYLSLTRILSCLPDDVLGNLFDREALRATLQVIFVSPAAGASTLALLQQIKDNKSDIEALHATNEYDWGKIVNREGWLLESAESCLIKYAEDVGWSEDDVTQILARYLKGLQTSRVGNISESSPLLGTLALIYLRQRLRTLILQLREDAVEYAREAHAWNPSQLALGFLPAWLEMYEQKAMHRALPYLVPKKAEKPLSTFVLRQNCKPLLQGIMEQLDPDRNFVIRNETHGKKGKFIKKDLGEFEVHCYQKDEAVLHPLVKFENLPMDIFAHLQRAIAGLTLKDVSSKGSSIDERFLNTPIVPDPFLVLLNYSVRELGPTFVQCMVLCGTPLPVDMDIPGRKDLQDELPYQKLDITKDIEFPKDVHAIEKHLREQYSNTAKKLKVVS